MHSFDAADSSMNYTKNENETTSSLWQKIEEKDDNMLMKLEWPRFKKAFDDYLEGRTAEMQDIVSQHLLTETSAVRNCTSI